MTDPANGRVVLYTFNGAGVDMWTGPPAEVGGAVDARTIYWQPVAYNASPDQMQTNTEQAEAEFVRLVSEEHPGDKILICAYSEGAIAASNLLDRMGVTTSSTATDLAYLKPLFLGGCSFGNPRRQAHHMLGQSPAAGPQPPAQDALDPGGSGIAPNCLQGTPDTWWDFANPGDLYAACVATGDALDDIHAIYAIVQNWTSGLLQLFERIIGIVAGLQVLGVAEAIYYAAVFFGVDQLAPHTTYEITHPVAGNTNTCLNWAVYHLNRLAAGYYP